MENLMQGLHSQMNRVREIIKEYEDPMLKGAGLLAASFMKQSIKKAELAIENNDVIEMLKAYKDLEKYEL